MKIIVLPKWKAEHLDLDERYIIISITDPQPFGEPAKIKTRWGLVDLLRLEFYDLEPPYPPKNEGLMTDDHAKEIWKFINQYNLDDVTLVVHCEAGVSRSPSIACAIADCLNINRTVIELSETGFFDQPANKHCYDLIRNNYKND